MVTAEFSTPPAPGFVQLKSELHQKLLESIDFSRIDVRSQDESRSQLKGLADYLSSQQQGELSDEERSTLVQQVMDEIYGFGPLESLMNDPAVSDILINRFDRIVAERDGQLESTELRFEDRDHLSRFIQRMVSQAGRRIDESSPIVDARLPDGSRLNAVIPPLAPAGPTVSIRRFGRQQLRIEDIINSGSLAPAMADFLILAVRGRMNLVVSGGSGAGKTTLLNCIGRFIPDDQRVITIEDTSELQLQREDVVSLETRFPNSAGQGAITQRDLLRNALRMRPDRIIVGEARGNEVLDMLQAMNSGHTGSMSTVHANDAREALERLEMLVALSGANLPSAVARQFVAKAVDIVIHVTRMHTGERRVTRISEAIGLSNGEFRVEDIFVYRSGVAGDTSDNGGFYATGYEPATLQRLALAGITIDQFRPLFVPRKLQVNVVE